jgi:hypothetical protein
VSTHGGQHIRLICAMRRSVGVSVALAQAIFLEVVCELANACCVLRIVPEVIGGFCVRA